MSEHPKDRTPEPTGTGGTPICIDLVPGDPPVPITVWRTARSGDDHSTIGARLAYRLIAAYSRPGETVIDLTDNHTLSGACLRGGRSHHKARVTDAPALIVGPATTAMPGTAPDEPDTNRGEPREPAAWFGDDLTDHLPPHGAPAPPAAGDPHLRGRVSLVVACWPLDDGDAANRVRLAWLLTACGQLLRRGGCLVLVVGVPAGAVVTPEDFTPVVDAASGAGLGYLQHIVAVAADTDGEKFTYYATDEELLALARASGGQWLIHPQPAAPRQPAHPPSGSMRCARSTSSSAAAWPSTATAYVSAKAPATPT